MNAIEIKKKKKSGNVETCKIHKINYDYEDICPIWINNLLFP